jgi:hypothetical protein
MSKTKEMESALLDAAAIALAKKRAPKGMALYRNDPVLFSRECFLWREGEGLTDYQEDVLAAIAKHGRVAVYGPHGLGKTAIQAIALLWFAITRNELGEDWKAPTTASAWRQLTHYLWPEVHKWSRKLDWKKIRRLQFDERSELLSLNLKLKYGEAFALASDNESSLEGAHADSLFFQFDESKAIAAPVWDAIEGAFSGTGEALALAASTPGEESGHFYDICSKKAGYEDWHVRHVTVEEAIAAGRISAAWVEQRASQWGRESAVFQNRVLGVFASSESDGVIPLAWVEAAIERWKANENPVVTALTSNGVDVGGGGEGGDLTTMALRSAWRIAEIRRFGRGDTMETTGRVNAIVNGYGGIPVIDVIGIGAGVAARLRELEVVISAFNAAQRPPENFKDYSGELGFVNMRAWAWWNLRELLDPARGLPIELPDDDQLIGDLTAPRWRVLSGGRIIIESKDEIRKRLGRSTDTGDAVVMAFTANGDAEGEEVVYNDDPAYRREFAEDHASEELQGVEGNLWGRQF